MYIAIDIYFEVFKLRLLYKNIAINIKLYRFIEKIIMN